MTKSYNNCMFLCFGNKIRIFREDFPNIIPAKFGSNWPSGFKIFLVNWPIRNRSCVLQPCFLFNWNEMRNFCRGLSKHHSCKVWFPFALISEKIFVYISQSETRMACGCQNEMKNFVEDITNIMDSCIVWF